MGLGAAIGGPIGSSIGALVGLPMQKRMFDKQHQYQTHVEQRNRADAREFAQNSIKWKVADAKAAGIHPLMALGASPHHAPSIGVGTPMAPDIGGTMGAMGQDIGRAVMANTSSHDKKIMDLRLENAEMDTEMKRLELTNARRRLNGQIGPGVPNDVSNIPAQVTSHQKGKFNQEAGSVTSVGFARNPDGGLTPVPSKDVKERIEDQFIPETVWAAQNYIAPTFGSQKNKPSKKLLPKGFKDWQWSVSSGSWKPVKGKGKTPWQRWSKWVTKWQD